MSELPINAITTGARLYSGHVREAIVDRLQRRLGHDLASATRRDIYDALVLAVREELTDQWLATWRRASTAKIKRVCYLSVEFLLGRSLINALSAMSPIVLQEVREALRDMGHDLDIIAEEEEDPGLGNGGLGRLAACFLDSLATLGYAATGYGRTSQLLVEIPKFLGERSWWRSLPS